MGVLNRLLLVVALLVALETIGHIFEAIFVEVENLPLHSQWNFMQYFDDKYNFLEYPQYNTLQPITVAHFKDLIYHEGINVYEPVGNVVKALLGDITGVSPSGLRACTTLIHFANSILLLIWLRTLLIQPNYVNQYSIDETLTVVSMLVAFLFLIHPLNMEVIGWLSAQNYAVALFFSILSSLCVERILSSEVGNARSLTQGALNNITWKLLSVLFYLLGCWAKAPSIVIPVVHVCRILAFYGNDVDLGQNCASFPSSVLQGYIFEADKPGCFSEKVSRDSTTSVKAAKQSPQLTTRSNNKPSRLKVVKRAPQQTLAVSVNNPASSLTSTQASPLNSSEQASTTVTSDFQLGLGSLQSHQRPAMLSMQPEAAAASHIISLQSATGRKRFVAAYGGFLSLYVLAVAAMLSSALSSNGSMAPGHAVGAFHRMDTKLVRAVSVIFNFSARVLAPTDLRGHYTAKEESAYRLDLLFSGNSLTESMAEYSSPSPPLGSAAASNNAAANEADAATTTTTTGNISPSWASAVATRADERLSVMMGCATLVAASLLAVAAFPRAPLVTLGWASYLICWAPGCGLVAHGWEQLGSDRYNYFPLAYLTPAALEVLVWLVGGVRRRRVHLTNHVADSPGTGTGDMTPTGRDELGPPVDQQQASTAVSMSASEKSPESSSAPGALSPSLEKQGSGVDMEATVGIAPAAATGGQGGGDEAGSRLRLWLVLLAAAVWAVGLAQISRRQLLSWRSDKTLLEHCVRMDPRDWECHDYLGDWYGFHEKNDALGRHHKRVAISLLPARDSVRTLLLESKMLLLLTEQITACKCIERAFEAASRHHIPFVSTSSAQAQSVSSRRLAADSLWMDEYYIPHVFNNHVMCAVITTGELLPAHADLLAEAAKFVANNGTSGKLRFTSELVASLDVHFTSVREVLAGRSLDYKGAFIW